MDMIITACLFVSWGPMTTAPDDLQLLVDTIKYKRISNSVFYVINISTPFLKFHDNYLFLLWIFNVFA